MRLPCIYCVRASSTPAGYRVTYCYLAPIAQKRVLLTSNRVTRRHLSTTHRRVAIDLSGPEYTLIYYVINYTGGNWGNLSSWCSCGAPEAQLMLGRHLDFDQLRAIAGVVSSLLVQLEVFEVAGFAGAGAAGGAAAA